LKEAPSLKQKGGGKAKKKENRRNMNSAKLQGEAAPKYRGPLASVKDLAKGGGHNKTDNGMPPKSHEEGSQYIMRTRGVPNREELRFKPFG